MNKKRPVNLSLEEKTWENFQIYCIKIKKKPSIIINELMEETMKKKVK